MPTGAARRLLIYYFKIKETSWQLALAPDFHLAGFIEADKSHQHRRSRGAA